jgi:hypothetical protein
MASGEKVNTQRIDEGAVGIVSNNHSQIQDLNQKSSPAVPTNFHDRPGISMSAHYPAPHFFNPQPSNQEDYPPQNQMLIQNFRPSDVSSL